MGFGNAPKPPPVVVPPPSAAPATMANPAVAQAAARQKSKPVGGAAGDLMDSNKSLQAPTTSNATLLGD